MIHLPDVNVLVALLWEAHIHHRAAVGWFRARGSGGWATCSTTQTGFVRVSSNPKVLNQAITPREAAATLQVLVGRPEHTFFAEDHGYVDNPRVPHDAVTGYRQVTDAHLIGLARRHNAAVVSLDRGMAVLGGETVVLLEPEPHPAP